MENAARSEGSSSTGGCGGGTGAVKVAAQLAQRADLPASRSGLRSVFLHAGQRNRIVGSLGGSAQSPVATSSLAGTARSALQVGHRPSLRAMLSGTFRLAPHAHEKAITLIPGRSAWTRGG
jgi:hypothetical protein